LIRVNTFNQKFLLTKENIIPKLFSLAYYFIVLVLLFSGFSKIIDPENFLKVLNITLGFLGGNILILIATVLPVLEIALGLMLILKIKVKETLIAVLLLFVAFTAFAIYGTLKGFNIDCGCFGSNVSNEFGVWMIIRNIVLVDIAFFNFNYNKGHLNFES
jgi:hypothetical protein